MDTKILWLVENLLKARIRVDKPAYGFWLVTTYFCTQLAKARLRLMDPHMMEFTVGNQRKRQRLHLFEKLRPAKIYRSSRISKFTQNFLE